MKTEINSEAQIGPSTVPSDSGVEVGQESEQELVHVKTPQAAIAHDNTHNGTGPTETGKEEGTNCSVEKAAKDGAHIVFGGESIMEKKETRKPQKG